MQRESEQATAGGMSGRSLGIDGRRLRAATPLPPASGAAGGCLAASHLSRLSRRIPLSFHASCAARGADAWTQAVTVVRIAG